MRSPSQVFSKQYNTSSRQANIDYDYVDTLSESDKEWLAKFTENYYSASFDLNPAFVRKAELISLIEAKIARTSSESAIKKWTEKLNIVRKFGRKFYQVSHNEDKSRNIDLRIIKKVDIFYKNDKGGYSTSKYFKYSNNNVIDPTRDLDRKACNDRSNNQSDCVMSKFGANPIDDYEIDTEQFSPEDYMTFNEAAEEQARLIELGIEKDED